MKFIGKYYKTIGKKRQYTGGQIFVCKELANIIPFQHKNELVMEYDDKKGILIIRNLNEQ